MAEVVLAVRHIEVLGEIFKRWGLEERGSMSRGGGSLFLLPEGEKSAAAG